MRSIFTFWLTGAWLFAGIVWLADWIQIRWFGTNALREYVARARAQKKPYGLYLLLVVLLWPITVPMIILMTRKD